MIEGAALPLLEDMRVVDTAGPSRVTMTHGDHGSFDPDERVYGDFPSNGGGLILSDDSSDRRDVIAYKAERGESEIIALPQGVNWKENCGIPVAKRREMREDVGTYCFSLVSEKQAAIEGSIKDVTMRRR
jgi:hypothetical protein